MIKRKKQVLTLRILLGILIVCNMVAVFWFSSHSGAKSAAVSEKITIGVVEKLPEDYVDKIVGGEDGNGATVPKPPVEVPTEPPVEIPTEPPVETPTEPPVETPTEPPVETPTEPPVETPTEPPVETPTEPPVETPIVPPAEEPGDVEEPVTPPIEESKPEDPKDALSEEQLTLVKKMHTPIRKLAHMLEFGSLATLAFLFLLTWRGKMIWRYAASLGFSLVYAATDELHQLFQEGRGARLSDVVIDFLGALIACTIALAIAALIRYKPWRHPIVVGIFAKLKEKIKHKQKTKQKGENKNGSCQSYS